MKVIICGGGVIGTSIAYFLSQRNVEAVVVERTGVANGASGKSGGFLALDWCDGSPLAPLARRSFALNVWFWRLRRARPVRTCGSYALKAARRAGGCMLRAVRSSVPMRA